MELILHLHLYVSILAVVTSGEQLLHSLVGEVGRGNYTYYTLMYEGPITLYLYSQFGDADLYVSQTVSKPTFEPETYCLQSCTCGLDVVQIPHSFSRPVAIGVYGHISHEASFYQLDVYYREEEEEEDSFDPFTIEFDEKSDKKETRGNEKKQHNNEQERSSYVEDDETPSSYVWTVMWFIVDVLVEALIS